MYPGFKASLHIPLEDGGVDEGELALARLVNGEDFGLYEVTQEHFFIDLLLG